MTTLTPPTARDGTARIRASGPAWDPARIRWLVLALAVIAGAVAALATQNATGPAPTGDPTTDAILVGVGVAAVSWLGAAAMRWDAALIAILAGIGSWSIIGAIVGIGAAVVGSIVKVRPGQRSTVNVVLIGIAMNIAARSELGWFLGASTIVAFGLAAYVGIVGYNRRNRRSRQVVLIAGGTAVAVAVIGSVAFGIVGYVAANDLRAGNDLTKEGLEQLGHGEIAAASTSFSLAADRFAAADDRVENPVAAAAAYIPGVAQYHRVVTGLSSEAAAATRLVAAELDDIDLDALTVTDGRIDLDQIRSIQAPLQAINNHMDHLAATIDELDSPWLVPPVSDRLHTLAGDVARQRQRGRDALSAATVAPDILGGNEARTYFIAFTTPSEARGLGGFMGNWAEMTIDDGKIALTAFGRADDLNEAGSPDRRFSADAGLDEWLARYGPYNLTTGPDGTTGPEVWKNMTMSPDMATIGRAIADLYPQSGGEQLDGVFVMDVYTLARFLEFTGPIPLPDGQVIDGQTTVGADNAAKFLLHDQYDVTKTDERVDVLEEFSHSVIDALLSGSLPPPTDLLDTLGPMVDQGRFTGWAERPAEEDLLDQIGMSGTLPEPGSSDALAITFNNAVGNKIDYYLDADTTYEVHADAADNTASATLTITMTNGAPDNGQPNYVIGNPIGLPVGTNRTWVSIYSRLPVADLRLDGEPVASEPSAEAGYFVTAAFVTLPAGSSATLTATMEGPVDVSHGYDLVGRTPPTVAPTPLTVDVTWVGPDGVERSGETTRHDPGDFHVAVPVDPADASPH